MTSAEVEVVGQDLAQLEEWRLCHDGAFPTTKSVGAPGGAPT